MPAETRIGDSYRRLASETRIIETIIVDGYNLLHFFSPGFADRGALQRERNQLEAELERFRRRRRARILLIYDGSIGVTSEGRRRKGFEVYVSRPPRQADDVILDLCRKLEGSTELAVVTSDFHDIGTRLRGLPIRLMGSREFVQLLRRQGHSVGQDTEGAAEAGGEKPTGLSAGEVADWLRDFGFRE